MTTMQTLPLQFELIDFQGFLTVAVYFHYFSAGSLKLHTHVQLFRPEEFEAMFVTPAEEHPTRRWLPPGESPYPGYCRAPGSNICRPILCNCDKLKEIWDKMLSLKSTYKNIQGAQTLHP